MSITFDNPHYAETKKKLDGIGCGMCLAKWTQVTMHLQMGQTHSCHHPSTHHIPVKEIKRNPSALHNTRFKKKKRKEMLEGKRPAECDYCWNVEDNSDRFSDRVFKSNESWSLPHFNEIATSDWRADYNPKYVEVAFSNRCNFKCSYCGPSFSSSWVQEANKYGAYPTMDSFNDMEVLRKEGKMPINHREHNPYVEAFWKWWPDLYRDLHTFRITGGEPLLSKDTWGVLDYIINEPNPNRKLNLAINSNLGIQDALLDKFIEKVNRIEDEDRVNEFIIFTSVDGWGEQAEYIRNGLEFNRFWDNMNKVLTKCPKVNLTIMSTFNALSVPSYKKLIDGVYDLKKEYASTDRYWTSAIFLDSSYLRYPTHQTVQILPQKWAKEVFKTAQYTDFLGIPKFDHKHVGYSDIETQKIKRIYDWMISREDDEKLRHQRYNFGKFFKAHDERRGTNFVKTYPELEDFWHYCQNIKI
jgi:uncharacterized Fe-S cluster-containing radical SAM superfamily protein|tara:strand:- start:329 stop:1735 length:1407 start_codon:yes stop_codon:yes gene_type:complete